MASRILKARYFAHDTFLTAKLGHNPSYTWRSLHSTQDLLRLGCRWKVGDGSRIKVWGEPWLRTSPPFRLQEPVQLGLSEMRVCDLMLPGLRAWNPHVVRALFHEDIAEKILSLPLYDIWVEDVLLWNPDSRGAYTVKSAYQLCQTVLAVTEASVAHPNWQLIWRLEVPPKIRHFVWRSCTRCLPTRVRISDKGGDCTTTCAVCGVAEETTLHTLLTCARSQRCWEEVGLWAIIETYLAQVGEFKDLFFVMANKLVQEKVRQFVMTLWSIWASRNDKVWNNVHETPTQIVARANVVWSDWSLAQAAR